MKPTKQRFRRVGSLAALALAFTMVATACGGSSDESTSADGTVTLRMSWWGSDSRHKVTQEVIDAFEKENPTIKVEGEFGEWNGYWDKLATAVAAKSAPDVIQMDEKYLREYAGRGALLDLKSQSSVLDTTKFDANSLATGEFDGGLYGLTTGSNAYSIVANPALFEAAGVELPDDETWTWDDYAALAAEITAKSPAGTYGSQAYGSEEAGLIEWVRQHGESMYTEDGKLGFQPATLAAWWAQLLALRDAKATPDASFTTEEAAGALDQSGTATNKVAMGFWWTNQIPSLEAASGSELKLLRMPSGDGTAKGNGMYYKSSMFWSVSAQSAHPVEAAKFVNFLANSTAAGELILVDRGVPSNTDVRAAITSKLTPTNTAVVEFIDSLAPELSTPPSPPPVGGSAIQEILKRYSSEVLFDRLTPDQAAEQFIAEANTAISA